MKFRLSCLMIALAACVSACTDDNDDTDTGGTTPPPSAGVIKSTSIVGLGDDGKLYTLSPSIPPAAPAFTISAAGTPITGYVGAGTASPPAVVTLDIQPSTKTIFVLFSDDRLYTVNPSSGAATLKGIVNKTPGVTLRAMAFDPVSGNIRMLGQFSTAQMVNYQVNPNDATIVSNDTQLGYVSGDTNASSNPTGVSAIAYTGDGSSATTAFVIDTTNDDLVRLGSAGGTPDNAGSGKLNTVAQFTRGVGGGRLGFDIEFGNNPYGYIVDAGTATELIRVNLATGELTSMGSTNSGIRLVGAAVVPGTGTNVTDSGGVIATPGIIVGEAGCSRAFGTGSSVTKDEGTARCPVCSIDNEGRLIDGDVTLPATASVKLGLLFDRVSVTVKAPAGTKFPVGSVAGGLFAIPTSFLGASVLPDIQISTELNGAASERFDTVSTLLYARLLDQGLTPGEDKFFIGFPAGFEFDAVKISFGVGAVGLLSDVDIYAACVNGTAGSTLPPGLLPL